MVVGASGYILEKKDARLALRFNADKPSLLEVTDTMHDGTLISYRLLSLPLYLIDHANRLVDEATESRC